MKGLKADPSHVILTIRVPSPPEYPEPLLIELTDTGYKVVPEVVDYYLFDCKYDSIVTKLLERKCLGILYQTLDMLKRRFATIGKEWAKRRDLLMKMHTLFIHGIMRMHEK